MTHHNNGYGTLGQPTAPGQPQPPKKSGTRTALKVAGGIGVFILGVGALGAITSDPTPTPAEAVATTFTAPTATFQAQRPAATTTPYVPPAPRTTTEYVPPKPAAPAAWNKDGLYKVGKDIAPGEYTYTVKRGNGYWATCTDPKCSVGESMIDNDWIPTKGATGYLSITSDVVYIELKDLQLAPA